MSNNATTPGNGLKNQAIYDGFEFDPNLDIYWDALENTLESALDFVPPSDGLLPTSPEK